MLSFHSLGEEIIHTFGKLDSRKKIVDTDFEDASKKQLLKIADMDQTAFDFRNTAPVYIPPGELQSQGKIVLRPPEVVSPFSDF
jgi:hypothetical protein